MRIVFDKVERGITPIRKWGSSFYLYRGNCKKCARLFGGEFNNNNPFLKQLNLKPYDN